MDKVLIVGNWKMNNTVSESMKLITAIGHHLKTVPDGVELVVAPSFTALYSAGILLQETSIKLAAQDIFWEDSGAYTGEISGPFLKDLGCSYVIIGHSERRHYFGETDDAVNKKVYAALRNELTPIMCVGETLEQREAGNHETTVEAQVKTGLSKFHTRDAEQVVIAYEPVWAIGTGKNATPSEIQGMHHFIRNLLAKMFDAPTANSIYILYGGSVKAKNSSDIFMQKEVNGALIGGASLSGEEFAEIIRAAAHKTM